MRSRRRNTAQTIDAGKEIKVLANGKIAIEREFLRHVAEPVAGLRGIAPEIETSHPALTLCWLQQTAEHLESGGLAGAVGAEQTEDLAARISKLMWSAAVKSPKRLVRPRASITGQAITRAERCLRLGERRATARTTAQHVRRRHPRSAACGNKVAGVRVSGLATLSTSLSSARTSRIASPWMTPSTTLSSSSRRASSRRRLPSMPVSRRTPSVDAIGKAGRYPPNRAGLPAFIRRTRSQASASSR